MSTTLRKSEVPLSRFVSPWVLKCVWYGFSFSPWIVISLELWHNPFETKGQCWAQTQNLDPRVMTESFRHARQSLATMHSNHSIFKEHWRRVLGLEWLGNLQGRWGKRAGKCEEIRSKKYSEAADCQIVNFCCGARTASIFAVKHCIKSVCERESYIKIVL